MPPMPQMGQIPPEGMLPPQTDLAAAGFMPHMQMTRPVFQQQAVTKEPEGEYITSPMVGTFYAASGEDAEPYIRVGDVVKKGQVIGIVEAMKLMNEIESPYDGIVEKILVENKAMVGFGDELVLVRTNE